ncbi:MAG: heme o synthase [Streptosporangiales bacterium]|nr:heme o synthase [Streptosporangiales bacterium]MBO0890630.1 heme o synthase [Acidothermales bacterium]
MTAVTSRPRELDATDHVVPRSFGVTVRAYAGLTKPRIIELLLITTVPVMFLAARGLPPLWPVVATLVGGTLSAGSANALNCYIDRDIDLAMRRTRRRPLPTASVSPREALVFGVVLGVVSTVWLALAVNPLSAWLALGANLFYVLVYSALLKRRTSANIVWGGIAGCFPTVIGWTAVTGRLSLAPVALFLVVFFWTPPHTWALAMRYRDDYAAAGVPMLPVVATPVQVARRMLAYSVLTVASSLLLWPLAHTGPVYVASAAVLGAVLLAENVALLRRAHGDVQSVALLRPMRLFHWSNMYAALLFVAVAVDALVH